MGMGGSFIGDGIYKSRGKDGKNTKPYKLWRAMLQRCYGNSYHSFEKTYSDCVVCEEWLNFQNFAKWVEENYYEIPNEIVELDKDIIKQGNKIYCPQFCRFVPAEINLVFSKNNSKSQEDKVGVDVIHNKKGDKYKARCRFSKGIHKCSKICSTFEEAKNIYINMKNKRVHELAVKYKNYITEDVYLKLIDFDLKNESI